MDDDFFIGTMVMLFMVALFLSLLSVPYSIALTVILFLYGIVDGYIDNYKERIEREREEELYSFSGISENDLREVANDWVEVVSDLNSVFPIPVYVEEEEEEEEMEEEEENFLTYDAYNYQCSQEELRFGIRFMYEDKEISIGTFDKNGKVTFSKEVKSAIKESIKDSIKDIMKESLEEVKREIVREDVYRERSGR